MDAASASEKADFRSGLVALVGKPNVGKSTLLNAMVGARVAITSRLPQTTRRRVLGVMHRPGCQVVLVDTPGLTRPQNELGRRMQAVALAESKEADLVLFLGDLSHPPTAEDREAAALLARTSVPVWLVGTKADRLTDRGRLQARLQEYAALGRFGRSLAVSAVTGLQLADLEVLLASNLPPGPPYYPPDQVSDQNQRLLIEEVVREKVLHLTRQEVPHAVAVQVEDLRPGTQPDTLYVACTLYVEKQSQKGILIGRQGSMLKKIGSLARQDLEKMLETRLFLELWVKVKEDWRDRPDWLRSLGYE